MINGCLCISVATSSYRNFECDRESLESFFLLFQLNPAGVDVAIGIFEKFLKEARFRHITGGRTFWKYDSARLQDAVTNFVKRRYGDSNGHGPFVVGHSR